MTEQIRMPELNKVIVAGRMTHDIELRFTPTNQPVTSFRIAVNRNYRDTQTGQWKELASFIPVVAWGKLAERCNDRLKKGNALNVEGRLQSRSFETKTGDKRFILEIVADRIQFLTKMNTGQEEGTTNEDKSAYNAQETKTEISDDAGYSETSSISDEEIPF